LFDNILHFRIKWPKGFSGVAKDLISKLLKTNPAERIPLNEVTEHPWFKANPPLRPVLSQDTLVTQPSLKQQIESEIKKENY
jgi:serine/threonine protein kinase